MSARTRKVNMPSCVAMMKPEKRTVCRAEVPLEPCRGHVRFGRAKGENAAGLAERCEVNLEVVLALQKPPCQWERDCRSSCLDTWRDVRLFLAVRLTLASRTAALSLPIAQTRSLPSLSASSVNACSVWIVWSSRPLSPPTITSWYWPPGIG